ncbi:Spherulation-specific family 4-domain-containing protein [Mycena floridula]|nr:Spherulation-specific family 4-domain-containing protein [Mycena floridula]
MLRSSLVFLSALSLRSVAALVSNGIIFPLFVYPGEGCSSWSALNSAISNNPSVPFIVVVNPNSGPGDSGSQPDSNYQSCIPKLSASGSSQNSVTLVGYVDTNYGSRSSNDVLADINTYGQWSSSYKLQGVYLDRTAATSQFESAYRSYASQAQQAFGSAYVVMDTGTIPSDISFFTFANLLVTFTNVYSSFRRALTISDAAPAQKQAVILYSGPSTTPETLVKQLVQMGIGSMFITDASNFERPPNDLGGLVSDVKGEIDFKIDHPLFGS